MLSVIPFAIQTISAFFILKKTGKQAIISSVIAAVIGTAIYLFFATPSGDLTKDPIKQILSTFLVVGVGQIIGGVIRFAVTKENPTPPPVTQSVLDRQ
jgi:hypothetical protein